MKNYLLALVLGVAALGAQAVEMEISAKDVYEKVQGNDPGVLFVDVRDPLEIMFTGFTDVVHVNIPYLLADRTRWEDERSIYRLYRNPDFVAQIKAELARRGMKEDAEVITRAARAASVASPAPNSCAITACPMHAMSSTASRAARSRTAPRPGCASSTAGKTAACPGAPR